MPKVSNGPTSDLTGGKTSAPNLHSITPCCSAQHQEGGHPSYGIQPLGSGIRASRYMGGGKTLPKHCLFCSVRGSYFISTSPRQSCSDSSHSGAGEGAADTVGQLSPAWEMGLELSHAFQLRPVASHTHHPPHVFLREGTTLAKGRVGAATS